MVFLRRRGCHAEGGFSFPPHGQFGKLARDVLETRLVRLIQEGKGKSLDGPILCLYDHSVYSHRQWKIGVARHSSITSQVRSTPGEHQCSPDTP